MNGEDSPDVKFVDAESYMGGRQERTTFKEIVLQHFKKIANFQSTEFRGGYWEQKINSSGMITHFYIPDSREVYVGSISYLYDLLLPYFDKEMTEASKKVDEDTETAKKYWLEHKESDSTDDTEYVSFLNKKLKLKRGLFQELSKLLHRLKYLEGKTFEAEE